VRLRNQTREPVKTHYAPFLIFVCPKNATQSRPTPLPSNDLLLPSMITMHREPPKRTANHRSAGLLPPTTTTLHHAHRSAAKELLPSSLSPDSRPPQRSPGAPDSRFTTTSTPFLIPGHRGVVATLLDHSDDSQGHRTSNHTGFESSFRFHSCCFL